MSRLTAFLLFASLLVAGCDTSGPSPEDRARDALIGTWSLQQQTTRYVVETDQPQTILDPDTPGTGGLSVTGNWFRGDTPVPVDATLRYVRHAPARFFSSERATLYSTHPIRDRESVYVGQTPGMVLEVFPSSPPSGFFGALNGTSFPASSSLIDPGSLPRTSFLPTPLPDPLQRTLPPAEFTGPATGNDTLVVAGTLTPATQSLPALTPTVVDVEPTSREWLQSLTYRFAPNDSVRLTAQVDGRMYERTGTWRIDRDSLHLLAEGEDPVVVPYTLDGDQLRFSSASRMCPQQDDDCMQQAEFLFGMRPGSLLRATNRLENRFERSDVTPTATSATAAAPLPSLLGPRSERILHETRSGNVQ